MATGARGPPLVHSGAGTPRCCPPMEMEVPMAGESIVSSPIFVRPTLDIGRAYDANQTATILGISVYVLNERVREGKIKPVFDTGDRRYSGYVIARLLDWPLSDDPRDYMPSNPGGRRQVSHRRVSMFRTFDPPFS